MVFGLFRFRPSEGGAILDRSYPEAIAENDPHPVCRSKAAIEGDSFQWPITALQHHTRSIDARAWP
jgi:hypothetical protein